MAKPDCDCCGKCCIRWTYPNKPWKDPKAYARYFNKTYNDRDSDFYRVVIRQRTKTFFECIHFDHDTNRCTIYTKRPKYCRNFYCEEEEDG